MNRLCALACILHIVFDIGCSSSEDLTSPDPLSERSPDQDSCEDESCRPLGSNPGGASANRPPSRLPGEGVPMPSDSSPLPRGPVSGTAPLPGGPGIGTAPIPSPSPRPSLPSTAPTAPLAGSTPSSSPGPSTGSTCGKDTYGNYARSFVATHCVRCHNDLGSLSGLKSRATRVKASVSNGSMPIGSRLANTDIQRFIGWMDCGLVP